MRTNAIVAIACLLMFLDCRPTNLASKPARCDLATSVAAVYEPVLLWRRWWGSAFAIEKHLFLTAKHVVTHGDDYQLRLHTCDSTGTQLTQLTQLIDARVAWRDEQHDLAMLVTHAELKPIALSPVRPQQGTALQIFSAKQWGDPGVEIGSDFDGTHVAQGLAEAGSSGGAVMSDTGYVGVLFARSTTGSPKFLYEPYPPELNLPTTQ